MTATTSAAPQRSLRPAGRLGGRVDLAAVGPSLFVALNGIAFVVLKPGVNDLWAARARASAVQHGVGLTYWFGWFSGGSTPGNYSVLTPYLCAWIGTELVGALAAVAAMVLITVLVRATRYPFAACCAGAVAVLTNLWSGRIPFLLGSAIAVGALIALRHRNKAATVCLTLLSILASPVSGAFLALGLSGTFLTTRTREYRPIIAYALVTVGVAMLGVLAAFGAPGNEPFAAWLVLEVAGGLIFLWVSWPADHVRTTLAVSLLALVVVWLVPNGLGSNYTRFAFSCLPVLVVATSTVRRRYAVLGVLPVLIMGIVITSQDLVDATAPVSSTSYYKALAARLDKIPDLRDYRLEVVNHGAHAGDDALVNHAMLARGWETQADDTLNKPLQQKTLDPVTYKVWLDNNAVGYVALPTAPVAVYAEYRLVKDHRPGYLRVVWSDADWLLFRVSDPTPIVARPGRVLAHDQKSMTISVPCACTLAVRLRWSKFLVANLQARAATGSKLVDAVPAVQAKVSDDGTGWTTVRTPRPGTYVLRGTLRGILR